MKNFPSALIRQQSTKNGLGNSLNDTLKNIGAKAMSNFLSGGQSGADTKAMSQNFEPGYTRPDLTEMLEETNIFNETQEIIDLKKNYNNKSIDFLYNFQNGKDETDKIMFEDPFKFSSSIFSVINNYKYVFNYTVPSISALSGVTEDKRQTMAMTHAMVSPSLFNPYVGINVTGLTENVPLVNNRTNNVSNEKTIETGLINDNDNDKVLSEGAEMKFESSIYGSNPEKNVSDCSIRTLVQLSQEQKLGSETYRYQDFMYCKDLGKIPNNRLITLRRFPVPIGDNIYDENVCGVSDIGRMITWFDNDDNKLENICKYNYRASWEKFTAEIDYQDSQDKDKGLVGSLAHFLSPTNNQLIEQGFSQKANIFSQTLKTILPNFATTSLDEEYYDTTTLKNYDKHKLYEPANRIKEMYKYDGNLEFNQEITLVFRYVLRSYDNINPRAAMMDLLGNIMTVTYIKGKFWGGENHIIGGGNRSVYDKADKMIEEGFDALGGIWKRLSNATWDLDALMSWASNMLDQGKAAAQRILNGAQKQAENLDHQQVMDKIKAMDKEFHWTSALKGLLKNQLGRPAIYAFNSILTGENNGLWHLTIGNPRNPIMSIGNLIIDSPAEIQHYGPLGLDDFPTEMSVTVTLKPQRARDRIDIERMYTKGRTGIYQPMNLIGIDKYYKSMTFGDLITLKNPDKTLRINLANV